MLVTKDIIRYYSPIAKYKKLLYDQYFYYEVHKYLKINLKDLYTVKIWDIAWNFNQLENESLLKFHDGICNCYFDSEKDCILFKLKYGI